MKTIIIGASFSGLVCAYKIKQQNPLHEVLILEKNIELGKKIKACGNGKCNFTNKYLDKKYYNHPDFVEYFIDNFNYQSSINLFNDLGMISKEITEGRIYPYTEQAITVVNAFKKMLKDKHINIKYNQEVIDIIKQNNQYLIKTNNNEYISDNIVIACGGKSYPVLGSNGSIFNILNKLKVDIIKPYPGLTGFITSNKNQKMLDGLRFKGLVKVYNKQTNNLIFEESGEIQFKENGISGIVIMNCESVIIRDITINKNNLNNYKLIVDFYEDYNYDKLNQLIKDDLSNLNLIVPVSLSEYILKITNKKKEIINLLKHFEFNLLDTYDFTKSQVTIGGVNISEVNNHTLELNKYKNIYIIGETLDIDGLCGGFNIQWAISSGYIVGRTIGDKNV